MFRKSLIATVDHVTAAGASSSQGVIFVCLILFTHDFRNAEKPGADFQTGAFRGKPVDFKMNLIFFDRQVDDAAPHSEPVGFTNREGA